MLNVRMLDARPASKSRGYATQSSPRLQLLAATGLLPTPSLLVVSTHSHVSLSSYTCLPYIKPTSFCYAPAYCLQNEREGHEIRRYCKTKVCNWRFIESEAGVPDVGKVETRVSQTFH